MLRITGNTTLAELQVELGKYGVELLRIHMAEHDRLKPVHAVIVTKDLACKGDGQTLAEAIDDAIGRLIHRVGKVIRCGA